MLFVRPLGPGDIRYYPQHAPRMRPGPGFKAWALAAYFGNPAFSDPDDTDHDLKSDSIEFEISAHLLGDPSKRVAEPLDARAYKEWCSAGVFGSDSRRVIRTIRRPRLGLEDENGALSPFWGPPVRLQPNGPVRLKGPGGWVETRTRSTFSQGWRHEGDAIPLPLGNSAVKIKETEGGPDVAVYFFKTSAGKVDR